MNVPCDVTKENDVKNAIESTVARFGTIHVALACAGIPWPTPTLTSQGPFNSEIFEKVLAVNVMGSAYMAKYAAVAMSKNKPVNDQGERGVLIFVSSVASFEGQRG